MRLMSQYIRKWLTSLIYLSKLLITAITAILCELDCQNYIVKPFSTNAKLLHTLFYNPYTTYNPSTCSDEGLNPNVRFKIFYSGNLTSLFDTKFSCFNKLGSLLGNWCLGCRTTTKGIGSFIKLFPKTSEQDTAIFSFSFLWPTLRSR